MIWNLTATEQTKILINPYNGTNDRLFHLPEEEKFARVCALFILFSFLLQKRHGIINKKEG